jgi:hypothetical protein
MFEEMANIALICALMGVGAITFFIIIGVYLYFVEDL